MQQKILEVIVGTPIVILLLYICVFRPLEVILDDYYDAKNKDLFEVSEKFKMIDVLDMLANSEIKEGSILIIDGCEYELDHEGIFRRKTDLDCLIEADIMYDYYLDEIFLNAETGGKTMRLIKLTKLYGLDDFKEIYLNVDEIGSFQKEKTDNYTMLFVKHNRILYEHDV